MAEGGSTGQDISFVWENESWALSNSDNSAGSDENLAEKPKTINNSNCPTPKELAGQATGKKKRRSGKPPSGDQLGNNDEAAGGGGDKGGELDHELHIWTERERRKKMRSMFSNLQALLPQLPPKVPTFSIPLGLPIFFFPLLLIIRMNRIRSKGMRMGNLCRNFRASHSHLDDSAALILFTMAGVLNTISLVGTKYC